MKNTKKRIRKNCILGAGFTIMALALPLLKFYALAPEQFIRAFQTPVL